MWPEQTVAYWDQLKQRVLEQRPEGGEEMGRMVKKRLPTKRLEREENGSGA